MKPYTTKWRCTNEKCGRVWESEFRRCQKCGEKTEMITEDNRIVTDAKPATFAKLPGVP